MFREVEFVSFLRGRSRFKFGSRSRHLDIYMSGFETPLTAVVSRLSEGTGPRIKSVQGVARRDGGVQKGDPRNIKGLAYCHVILCPSSTNRDSGDRKVPESGPIPKNNVFARSCVRHS